MGTDRYLGRRNADVDRPALDHFRIGPTIDQGQHPLTAQTLGQTAGHDVVFVIVGHGKEEVHLGDVLLFEQFFVRRLTQQHQRIVQFAGEQFGALLATLYDLDFVSLFQGFGDSQTDVAAAGDHDALNRRDHPPQLVHDRPNMLSGGEQEDLVTSLDDRIAGGKHRLVAPEDRGDPRIHVGRQELAHLLDRLADQQSALIGTHSDEADPPTREIEHLQRFRKFDQAPDLIGKHLLRAKRIIDREIVGG
jgi:hypothetical protein